MSTLLTIPEVACRLRVNPTTVRRWVLHGLLDYVALPHTGSRRSYRIPQSVLQHLLHEEGGSS